MAPRILSAIMFYPRGGSAHAARALTRCLRAQGCEVTLLTGSRSDLGGRSDAHAFYGEAVHSGRFDAALASEAPLKFEGPPGTAPLHPSFEERPGAPDAVFASLDDVDYERQVKAWSRELVRAGAGTADVLHLHHLTPLNEAAARVAPHVPIVGQLHGTELLMLERIVQGPPASWRHADRWAARLREWAQRCAELVVVPAGIERAIDLLEVPSDRVVALPSGVDVELFHPIAVDRAEFWRRALVEQPQGWLPGEPPGSARYGEDQVAGLGSGTVLLYAGRFTAVKRLDRLIGAFGRVRQRTENPVGLVLVGGHPGEWEGEHPAELSARLQVPDVFLAGWQPQEALPPFFAASDAVVMASEREQFGQVLVEAMACAVPVVATRSLGPASIVRDGCTGWLVQPGGDSLAAALAEVVADRAERERRGALARPEVCERFTWTRIAAQLLDVFEHVAATSVEAVIGD
jgi:glycosyltransferase involved in cell wall biosynthesis